MNETVGQTATPILEIENLSISFFARRFEIPAVMDFSCKVMPGEAMGIVGESGCGKSTVALGIMRDLSNIGRIVGGRIKFQGRDMGEMSAAELRANPEYTNAELIFHSIFSQARFGRSAAFDARRCFLAEKVEGLSLELRRSG